MNVFLLVLVLFLKTKPTAGVLTVLLLGTISSRGWIPTQGLRVGVSGWRSEGSAQEPVCS